jgi:hypothetical protein
MRVKFFACPRPRFAGLSAEKRRDTGVPICRRPADVGHDSIGADERRFSQ